eukprot:1666576-Pleurochrysis_carterae.AAC.1
MAAQACRQTGANARAHQTSWSLRSLRISLTELCSTSFCARGSARGSARLTGEAELCLKRYEARLRAIR